MTTHVLTCATKGCGRCIEVSEHAKDGFCFKCVPYGRGTPNAATPSGDQRIPLYDVKCVEEWTTDDGHVHQCRKTETEPDTGYRTGPHRMHRCCCGEEMVDTTKPFTTSTKPFTKADAGKPLMGCLPPNALLATARVLTHGAAKYGRNNWFQVEAWSRYYDALQRHLTMWWAGEDKDPDTGESHLAHAACCVLFLLELEALGKSKDDRPALGRAVEPLPLPDPESAA